MLDLLLAAADRLPRPDPRWHPYAGPIADFSADLAALVEAVRPLAALEELLAAQLDRLPGLPVPPPDAALAAAWQRLQQLPRPAGEHPFLNEIEQAIELAQLLLALAAEQPEAAKRFAELRPVPGSGCATFTP